MRLLRTDCEELVLVTFTNERRLPEYAILSHTWLRDEDEIAFDGLADLDAARSKAGWTKLDFARKQAAKDGLRYVWIDTCCINKSSSAELAEAINSMYRWYQRAKLCYVYLEDYFGPQHPIELGGHPQTESLTVEDALPVAEGSTAEHATADDGEAVREHVVSDSVVDNNRVGVDDFFHRALQDIERGNTQAEASSSEAGYELSILDDATISTARDDTSMPEPDLSGIETSRWFKRGWTLQELVAPSTVLFFDARCNLLGSLAGLTETVSQITGIHMEALSRARPVTSFSVAQRMCWASRRETTRVEDQAYSLLGIFNVNMPVIYGEGEGAFLRLQEEILRAYSDHTIFAWSERDDCWESKVYSERPEEACSSDLLANSASAFRNSGTVVPVDTDRPHRAYEIISGTVQLELPATTDTSGGADGTTAVLNCRNEDDCTKEVCIRLYSTGSMNIYGVKGEIVRPRIEMRDIYAMSRCCESKTINIIRRNYQVSESLWKTKALTIICRLEVRSKDSTYSLTGRCGPHGVTWDSSTHCFKLTSERLAKPVANVIRSIPDASLVSGRGPSKEEEILGQIDICRAGAVYGRLNFIRGPAGQSVSFDPDTPSYQEWRGRLLGTVVPTSMTWFKGVSMFATIEKRQLLHESIDIIQIQVAGNRLALRLGLWHILRVSTQWLVELDIPGGWAVSGDAAKSAAPGSLLFLLTAGIPSIAISIVRGRGDIDQSQSLALALGLPLAVFGLIVAVLKKERIFPSSVLYGWGHLRMMLFTVLVLANIVQAVLCGIYGHLASAHQAILEQRGHMIDSLDASAYQSASKPAIVWSVFSALFAFMIAGYRPLSRLKIFPSVGGKTVVLHQVLSLIVVVPFAIIVHRSLSVLRPWSSSDCASGTELAGVATFYSAIANATGDTFEATCRSFAFEGRLLLSILSMSIWLWVVDLLTAAFTAWLIFNLNMPMLRKWFIW